MRVPAAIRRGLNLPGPDEGIDLLARTRRGEYWAIQAKFRSQRDKPLTRRELGPFTSLAFNTCNSIALAVVAHTCTKPVGKRHLMRNTVEIGLDRWQSLDDENHLGWNLIVRQLKGRSPRPEPRSPRPHQRAAISAAKAHFIGDNATRGRLIMPCGSGKSLAAYWIAEALGARTILVAVPSLALIRQGVADWTKEFLARGKRPEWICVCSDETVGNLERDEFVGEVYELGLPTRIRKRLRHCFASTLKSQRSYSRRIRAVTNLLQPRDRLVSHSTSRFLMKRTRRSGCIPNHLRRWSAKRRSTFCDRFLMTATERVFRGDRDDVL